MLADSYIVPECLAQPRSFGGLMALYEANYIKLTQLVGAPEQLADSYLSNASRDCDLHLTVDARMKYTRLLRLTYLFDDPCGTVAEPDLSVKVYLDARMTEVVGFASHQRHAILLGLKRRFHRELDRRWSQNMMLAKWLDYLLDMGHVFRRAERLPSVSLLIS